MNRVFYTDGSCYNNGKVNAFGSAAWAEVRDNEVLAQGARSFTPAPPTPTNIRMELTAVIDALHQCGPEDTVTIYSDSAYVVNGMNQGWYNNWMRTGKTSTGKIPANLDLWRKLVRAYERVGAVTFIHIKGHQGNRFNEVVDALASQSVNELMDKLKGVQNESET